MVAKNEAERLAKQNPEETFYVLKVTGALIANDPAVRRLNLVKADLIPF